jgi:hypothetical protein
MVRLIFCSENPAPNYAIPFIFRKYNDIEDCCENRWFVELSVNDYTAIDIEWMDSKEMGKIAAVPSVDMTYKIWECDTEQEAFRLAAQLWAEWTKATNSLPIW